MNFLELKDKIKSHLVAGYPGLYIQSSEDARVDSMLLDIAIKLELSPKEWNLGYGWVDFLNKVPRDSQAPDTELANSLPALLDDNLAGKLLIIKDAKGALENQPVAVARLKQLLNRIQRHYRGKAAVILVSETLHIPPEIEAQITLLPLRLPHGEEIATQVERVCQELDILVPEAMRQRLNAACSGLSQEEIRLALAMVGLHHRVVSDEALALIQDEKEQIIAKSGVLEMIKVSENATDIGGLENLKDWLSRRAQIFRRLDEAEKSRLQAPKGVLIAGMPGCGKSLTAKAAAGLFQLPLLRLDIGSLLGKYVGESEHNMRRALTMAESVSPCILWIDELEKAFVGMSNGSGSEVSSRLFGYFLTWMQEKTGSVFVIATANNITALPPELLRKGRFDEVFYVGFPNAKERGAILDIHLKGDRLEFKPEERLKLVTQCRDYAGADIQNAINEARESAFLDNRDIKFEDIETAIELTVPLRETLREQVGKYEELFEKLKLKPASTFEGLSVAQMITLSEGPNAIRRKTVACSPDCPDDLLEKLASDEVRDVRAAVYQNPNCPEIVLTMRINIEEGQPDFDLELLHLACIHTQAPQDLLATEFFRLKLDISHKLLLAKKSNHEPLHQQLLRDDSREVRCSLALNKHLSSEILQQLAKDPDAAVRRALARISGLPTEVQALLAGDEAFDVREALAVLDDLNEAVQLHLTRDDDMDVRLSLAGRHGDLLLPDAVQLELLKDCLEVRQELARNGSICAATQLILAQDPHIEVRRTLAAHPALWSATWEYLEKDIETVAAVLAGNNHLNSALLQMNLSKSEFEPVRIALAGNNQLNGEVQTRLVKDPSKRVREALAVNDNTNDEVRKMLVLDEDSGVRRSLAYAKELQEDIQHLLSQDVSEVQEELARNSCINASTQQQLLNNSRAKTRRNLAGNSALVGTMQAILADDDSVEIRIDLAGNSQLFAPVADKLLNDVENVQLALARNRSLSEEQYATLFKNGSHNVSVVLAGNPSIGFALMAGIIEIGLAKKTGQTEPTVPGVWGAVSATQNNAFENAFAGIASRAANPKAARRSAETAVKVAKTEEVSKLLMALAENEKLPEELQSRLITSDFSSEVLMAALASNQSLSELVQGQLVTHKVAKVRQSLAENLFVSSDVQARLLNDPDSLVRVALLFHDYVWDPENEAQLAKDKDPEVRKALAGICSLRKQAQFILARDPEKDVRLGLLKRKYLAPLHAVVQATLAHDDDAGIRKQLALYELLSPTVQLILAGDKRVSVRRALAWQYDEEIDARKSNVLSDVVQHILQRDPDATVRLALADNWSLLPKVVCLLAGDPDEKVRAKIRERFPDLLLGDEYVDTVAQVVAQAAATIESSGTAVASFLGGKSMKSR